jgi:hypothetical protein
MFRHTYLALFPALIASLLLSSAAFSQRQPNQTTPVTATVTVLGADYKSAPEVAKADVNAYSDKTRLDVLRWQHAQSSGGDLEFAILIDESIRSSLIGPQLSDLSNFIKSLPPNSSVGLFYGQNGSAAAAVPFGSEHAKAAQSVRLTLGAGSGASPSIYLSLADLVKHWPGNPRARREVLLLSSGNDALNPGFVDPYFDSTLEAAQKAGITVHTLFIGGLRYGTSFRGDISQGKLAQLSEGTGGQVLNGLSSAPVSLAPFLTNLDTVLANQYSLTVGMEPSSKKQGDLRPLKIRTEERNLKITVPKLVLVPPPQG